MKKSNIKKLYKSKNDRMISGVCGGIAEYLNIDSSLIRIAWVLCGFGIISLVAYIVCSAIIPENANEVELIDASKKEPKKLYKSIQDRKIFGICGGLAEYLNIDSSLVRIVVLLLVFAFGLGIIWYFIAALVIPDKR